MHAYFAIEKLDQLGFVGDSAAKDFQRSQGLLADGVIGPHTKRALSSWENYFCGVTERLGLSNRIGKWIRGEVSWGTQGGPLPGFSQADMVDVYAESFAAWSRVCGLKFRHAKGEPAADITITFGAIDRKNGTLAWSELPNGQQDRPITQKYDDAEKFVDSLNPARGEIDLPRVARHEIGHAIGIPHIDTSIGDALMNAIYNRSIRDPQPLDIEQAVKRYGKSKVDVKPSGKPGEELAMIEVGGNRYVFQVEKLP